MSGVSAVHTLVEFAQQREEAPRAPLPSRELVLYDTPVEIMEPFPAAIQLGAIFDRYEHKSDTLSNTLKWYGREVMFFVQDNNPSREAFVANLIGLKQILSIGSNMPRDPWIIGDLVGEREALDLYCKVVSYLSGQQVFLEEVGSPHTFAQEVIDWITQIEGPSQEIQPVNNPRTELVPTFQIVINEMGVPVLDGLYVEPEEPITSWNMIVTDDAITRETAMKVYGEFQAIIQWKMKIKQEEIDREMEIMRKVEFTEFLKRENEILRQDLTEDKIKREQALVAYEKSTEQHTKDMAEAFTEVRTDYSSMENRLQNTVTELQTEVKDEKAKLAEAIVKLNNQEITIYGLQGNNCRLLGEVSRLESRVDRRPSLCTIS